MRMENTQIMREEKLGFFKVLKEALTIPFKNTHFIIFTFLTSIPLFFFMLIYETIFQHTLIETANILLEVPPPLHCYFCSDWMPLGFVQRLIEEETGLWISRRCYKDSSQNQERKQPHGSGPSASDMFLCVAITFCRRLADLFYVFHMIMKFRTAFVAPSSRVFGRGELVMDLHEIAIRYLKSNFIIDLAATLPLPQIVIWIVIPATRDSRADHANNTLALIVLIQYVPRLFLIFPLNQRIINSTGMITRTAWAGAAYNLLLYVLASHVNICSPILPVILMPFLVAKSQLVLLANLIIS